LLGKGSNTRKRRRDKHAGKWNGRGKSRKTKKKPKSTNMPIQIKIRGLRRQKKPPGGVRGISWRRKKDQKTQRGTGNRRTSERASGDKGYITAEFETEKVSGIATPSDLASLKNTW